MAEYILPILAILAVTYNTVVTHIVLKNDVRHLADDVKDVRADMKKLIFHLLEKK